MPLPGQYPSGPHGQKGMASFARATGKHIYRQNFPTGHTRRTIQLQEMRDTHLVCLIQTQSCRGLQPRLQHCERSSDYISFPTTLVTGSTDGTNDLSDVFKELAESAGLLGEAIYKIQLSWTRPEELKQANYALQSLPKGLRFLRVVPATESPKVMGLMGIHDPNALQHYAGYIYCPWCGKEGKNEGTMVNHLRRTHYRLGLVCNQCFGCPTVMSDSLCWHGCQNCQWYCVTSGSGLSNRPTCQTRSLH